MNRLPPTRMRFGLTFFHAAFLVALWLALWGSFSAANVIAGTAVATTLLVLFPLPASHGAGARLRPVAALWFLGYFLVKLLEANLQMARTILGPLSKVHPGIVAVPLRGTSDGMTTLVANFVTLTPGTLTVEVHTEPTTLYVHVMRLGDPDIVRRDVREIERRAIRAFGSPEAMARLRSEGVSG